LDRLRGIDGHVHALIGEREAGLPDDEMLARLEREGIDFLPAKKDGVAGVGQTADFQTASGPKQARVPARDALIPWNGPSAAQAAE
jgi:hypothetical protein